MNTTIQRAQGPSTMRFWSLVAAEEAAGLPRARAIAATVRAHPATHRNMLAEANGRPATEPDDDLRDPIAAFWRLVLDEQKTGISKAAAIRAVARRFPEAHARMLASYNREHGREEAAREVENRFAALYGRRP